MHFGHEQRDVYRVSIRYVTWAYQVAKSLKGIDRPCFFGIARGSALECASIQGCLEACEGLAAAQNAPGKAMLTRIVSMLTKLGQRNHKLLENSGPCDSFDDDNDNDNDNEWTCPTWK
jgi:hypothetical protein